MADLAPLLPRSKAALLRLLLRGGATTAKLAAQTHLHPTVVRRHMNDLVRDGLVESIPLPAKRGRPSVSYRLKKDGRDLLYARYDVVLDSVARALRARQRPTSAGEVFDEAGRELSLRLGGPRTASEVVTLFQKIGFEPELTRKGGQPVLLSHNCPILEVAKEHPDLACDAFHCSLLGGLLGTSKRPLRQAISRGAEYCVHELGHSS